ncbi:FecCD family ABC transporter permease [Azomonas macrocytogenes]|uniref:Iron complex transport system permease protein n=1 Tax=Azomonas macrocytogenes TaxID=69962 RepID=A0A839T5G7_AZOMA|nr:iron ABC transporter permease [Azomonas macrocytogenes]MBB3104328.1 iron complex transport system permease protein [Azomonas macrocytogenes]
MSRPVSPCSASKRRPAASILLPLLILLVVVITLVALGTGRYPVSILDILRFSAGLIGWSQLEPAQFDLMYNLLVEIRLPRVLAALLLGAALAVSGAAFQGVFRNPLVSPNLLGVLSGSAFGAALGMLLGGNWLLIQLVAFACGLVAVGLALAIAHAFGQGSLIMLVLGGIVSGALFAALLSTVKYVADPYNELPAITLWLMGSLASVEIREVLWAAIPMGAAIVALCASGRWLDALAMGDDEARTLGVPVALVRYGVIGCATLLGALTVSLAGMIGWVGLIVPHVARLLCGPGHSRLLPVSTLLGASFLLMADLLARSLADSEIPIGIVTELLGIPVFLLVLRRVRRGWN